MKRDPRPAGDGRALLTSRALTLTLALALASSAACRCETSDPAATGPKAAPPSPAPEAAPAVAVADDAGPGDGGDAAPTAPPLAEELAGATFATELRAAFGVAACGGDRFVPDHVGKELVAQHCALLRTAYDEYKREWLEVAMPFLAKLRPANLPTAVVYPFGGGDLVSALATFPDATEFTTLSLEIAGDIRPIRKADDRRLGPELATLRDHLGKLFLKAHSRTANLDMESREAIPGEIAFTMAALAIHGFEPENLRYFAFNTDGTLRYLTEADIAKNDKTGRWGPFAHAEIRFRKPGEVAVRVLRHVAYDLSDGSLRRAPALLKHLEAKGKVAAMTKAASHLLWDDENFAVIREYLMTHTDWMISDTTGVPPRVARKFGFVQDPYGQYVWPEPFGQPNNADAQAFKDLFKNAQPIAFRYGYPDSKSHGHIVVTRKPDAGAPRP